MKSEFAACWTSARSVPVPSGAFDLEQLEQRRFLDATAATPAIDATFGQAGYAAPFPAGSNQNLSFYNHLTAAPNGQSYAIAYDGSFAFPIGFTSFELLRINSDGSLDTSFGDGGAVHVERYDPTTVPWNGYVFTDDSLYVSDIFVRPDGKVLLAYRAVPQYSPDPWILAQFNTDGSPDTSFGDDGTVTIPVRPTSQNAPTVWLQQDGRIDVADADWYRATAAENLLIRQYNADGTPDETYGTDGVSTTSFTSDAANANAALAAVAAANETTNVPVDSGDDTGSDGGDNSTSQYTPAPPQWRAAIDGGAALAGGGSVIYLNDGFFLPDDTQNTPGIQTLNVIAVSLDAQGNVVTTPSIYQRNTTDDNSVYSLTIAVQGDGKALLMDPTANTLSRFNPDGSPDSSFNAALQLPTGFSVASGGVSVQSDGKIILTVTDVPQDLQGLVRLNADGSVDTTFAGGQPVLGFGTDELISEVMTNSDGTLLVSMNDSGWCAQWVPQNPVPNPTPQGAQLVRLLAAGGTPNTFDPTAAEAAIELALTPPPPPPVTAPVDDGSDNSGDGSDGSTDDGGDDTTTDDGGDDTTIDDGGGDGLDGTGDPAAYADGSSDDNSGDPADNLFTDPTGTTVWNPDGSQSVLGTN